jgi:hypothetical protein
MTREHEEWCRAELKAKMAEAKQLRAEVERLTELIKQMQVMGRAVDNIAATALEPKP